MFIGDTFPVAVIVLAVFSFTLMQGESRLHYGDVNSETCSETHDEPWDHFMLVMQWPQTLCETTNITHHHQCVIPSVVKDWTIHGLWPSGENRDDPSCCQLWDFDLSQVEDLEPQLQANWPNLFVDTAKDSFWQHEYEKHGTCAASVQGFEKEHDFFEQTLKLRSLYSPMGPLSASQIEPREEPYKFSQILDAIHRNYTTKTCIECAYIKSEQMQLLNGFYVCFSKDDQQPIDCVNCEHACYEDEEVYYHPINMRGKK